MDGWVGGSVMKYICFVYLFSLLLLFYYCGCGCCCCVCVSIHPSVRSYIHTYMHTYIHTSIHTYIHTCIHAYIHTYINTYMHAYIHTYMHTYIHTYMHAEWLAWLTSNCGRIGAIGSSPSNGLRPNMWGQKGFNPLCQCVYIYVCMYSQTRHTNNT